MGWRESKTRLPEKRCEFAGSCAGYNPFDSKAHMDHLATGYDATDNMIHVVETAIEITRNTFLRNCQVRYPNGDLMEFVDLQQQLPLDYRYWKSSFEGAVVYYFEWSRIEFFWKECG